MLSVVACFNGSDLHNTHTHTRLLVLTTSAPLHVLYGLFFCFLNEKPEWKGKMRRNMNQKARMVIRVKEPYVFRPQPELNADPM